MNTLQCEYPDCPKIGEEVKDYQRLPHEYQEDEEGPLSPAEQEDWATEPIALCLEHARLGGHV